MKRIVIALIAFTSCLPSAAEERPVAAADAKAIFARLQSLAGTWKGKSITQGWTGNARYELAAKGTVVIHRSIFDGEQNDGMITTFYLDGDRLLMTHYCEAKNQPTLVASTIDDASNTIAFRFLSGTNMASRDAGHMDSCVIRFVDRDHITRQWTWYSKGRETWLEKIEEHRSTSAN
jgi:hypothetical protein